MNNNKKKETVCIVFSIFQLEQMIRSIEEQNGRCGVFEAQRIDKTQFSMLSMEVRP